MQAITIGIGSEGVRFFCKHYLASELERILKNLHESNISIEFGSFSTRIKGRRVRVHIFYKNVQAYLENGQLSNFAPKYNENVKQTLKEGIPVFTITMNVDKFSATYDWSETWIESARSGVSVDPGRKHYVDNLKFKESFKPMDISIDVQFIYKYNTWQIVTKEVNVRFDQNEINVPKGSVILKSKGFCLKGSDRMIDSVKEALKKIDFAPSINKALMKILATIPSSGNLGSGIVYDFSLAGSELKFPNNDGIQIGINGGASQNGKAYTGTTNPVLPLPSPPTGKDHHLNMYVSNYEIDALHWAYYQAGKLNSVIVPTDLPDSDVLKVKSYIALEPALLKYSGFIMNAEISQNSAPTTSFQKVYIFKAEVMELLATQLPEDENIKIQGYQDKGFTSQMNLEQALKDVELDSTYFELIEKATHFGGMVVDQNMNFKMIIETGKSIKPEINFNVQRVDVIQITGLGMNETKKQTMQYKFFNASNEATFISSTINNFKSDIFGTLVWPISGESRYVAVLRKMGECGVPLPIMEGFTFDFNNAELSIQDEFVSIKANITYK